MKYQDIKTFEDACKALNIGTELPQVSMLPEKHQKAIIAFYMLTIIIEADEEHPGGSGFSRSTYVYGYYHSYVGSRLCLKDRERIAYVQKQFEQLYKDYFLI